MEGAGRPLPFLIFYKTDEMMKRILSVFAIAAAAAIALVSCKKDNPTDTPSGSALSFSQSEVTLYEGDKVTLEVNGLQEGESVKFSSADRTIAKVTSKGVVTAVAAGETTITATSKTDETRTATCKVTVEEKPADYVSITGLSLSESSVSLREGNTVQLSASVEPANATDAGNDISWSTSDAAVATVSNGLVSAIAQGSATVKAVIKDSKGTEFSASCAVTVTSSNVPSTAISISPASLKIQPGKTAELTVSFEPADHTDNPTLSWESSNTAVATVEGGVVTAIAEGNATVTARAGELSATCEVTVADVELVINMKTVSFPYTWPEADEYSLDNVTMETWINTAGNSGKNESIIGIEGVFLLRTEDSQFQLIVGGDKKDNEEYSEIKLASSWTVNEWVHLAATYTRAGKAYLYINGEQVAEADVKDHGIDMNGIKKSTGLRPGENDSQWGLIPFSFIVGNACDAGRFIQGSIAYTRVWTRALGADEIKANMYKATPSSSDGLLANWYFNEGSGNTIADHSGKGHTLTAKTWTSDKPKAEQDADIEWIEGTLPAVN